MTHKVLFGLTEAGQAWETKGEKTMAKKDPEKVLKDLNDYRVDGDRQRVLDEIESYMDVESVDDNHATVKHAWLGFAADREGVDRFTCELATWEMKWDKQSASWWVENWADVDTIFQIDFTKDRIPWKKIRDCSARATNSARRPLPQTHVLRGNSLRQQPSCQRTKTTSTRWSQTHFCAKLSNRKTTRWQGPNKS